MAENWHALSYDKALKILGSDFDKGLAQAEVATRRKKTGPNVLQEEKPLSKLKIFLAQFKSPLIYILVLAGIIVLLFQKFTDSIVIFGAVALNTAVGFWQENKTTTALRKLKKVVRIEAEVIRDGRKKRLDSQELVLGDIMALTPGNRVPADGRLIVSHNLKINEAPLTGEWLAAKKCVKVLAEDTPLADRENMVYMGCLVEDGKGKAVVTAIGACSEIGKIAGIVREEKEAKTPLQKKLTKLSKIIGLVIVLLCIFIFLGGLLKGRELLEMFETAVAVAVAAIPEGLPVALTVILALGMERILKKKGLVRKLVSAETLGSTSLIATDKTLTLTEGKMVVAETVTLSSKVAQDAKKSWSQVFFEKKDPDQILAITIAVLCNEAFVENPKAPPPLWRLVGRPTDRALLLVGAQVGINSSELEKEICKVDEIPFNPKNKFIASLYKTPKNTFLYVSGAPEKILSLASFVQKDGRQRKLTNVLKSLLFKKLENLTKQGLRVVAVAYKKTQELAVKDITFVAFIALKDPLRPEAKEAIYLCRQAGMKPILVTGDHLLTAKAVAKELGLKAKKENVILGQELDKMSDVVLQEKVKSLEIYARVEPAHKLRIIEAWQQRGQVVAMTGDGVNDAPALKKADIGVALGSGTDIAKEVSDLILLTDNFNIIVAAVEEGRVIIDNIRKVITYLLSDSFTETILIAGSIIFGLPLPITAVQILWVNLIEDGLPNIALAFEPKERDVMRQKPRGHDTPLLTPEMVVIIFIIGLITDLLLLGLFFWFFKKNLNLQYIQTMIFAALTIDSLFYVFSCKSLRKNIWHLNIFSNKFLLFALLAGFAALAAALYLPFLQKLLATVALGFSDWLILIALGIVEITLIEAAKWWFIKHSKI